MNTRPSGSSNPSVVIGETGRLLYIEDDQSNLTLVEWILAREAHVELLSAIRGRHGLELAQEHQPDLIVLDLQLPDMPGETVLKCLQADDSTRRIPVVVLSSDTSEKRIKRLLRLGASDYLTKPLDIPRLLDVIAAHLKQHR